MIKTMNELVAAAQAGIECLDAAAAKALCDASDDAVVIDVREAEEVAKSKLDRSIHISRGMLEMQAPKACPDPDTLILTHCGVGGRASLAAATLRDMGYRRVHAVIAPYEELKRLFD